jgi:uncharacterized membrane protein YhaH (DUF805 family)
MRFFWILLAALLAPSVALAAGAGMFGTSDGPLNPVGWAGFTDMHFMADSFGALALAIVLGAVIGFHPTTTRTVDRLEEADMPKIFIMYAFIGAVIGVTVREFGMVIGVVVFGIGGLIRFRTDTGSTRDTGRLIVVTLAGLTSGLGLPHFAVITTAFAFVLIHLFDTNPTCRVRIEQLPSDRLGACADAYRATLVAGGCKIIAEHRSAPKGRVEYVFRLPRRGNQEGLHAALCAVNGDLRGEIDWIVE